MPANSARRGAALIVGLAAAGALALAIASAPAVVAAPTTTLAPATTTAAEPTTTTAAPTPTSETMSPEPTASAAATSTEPPATSTARPTASTAEPTPSATPAQAVDVPEGLGGLKVWAGPLVMDGVREPGGVVNGQMSVQVQDTRPGSTGWDVDVKTTAAQGGNGNSFTPGSGSYYRAADTACSTSAGTIPLTLRATTAVSSRRSCPDALWTSDLGIGIPPDVVPDEYTMTITHSVY